MNNSLNTASLERDTAAGFGTAAVIQTLSGSGTYDWEDSLALNGVSYYYRYRETRTGYASSSYVSSTPTSGKPTTLSGPA